VTRHVCGPALVLLGGAFWLFDLDGLLDTNLRGRLNVNGLVKIARTTPVLLCDERLRV
jgi:hypothetical protein